MNLHSICNIKLSKNGDSFYNDIDNPLSCKCCIVSQLIISIFGVMILMPIVIIFGISINKGACNEYAELLVFYELLKQGCFLFSIFLYFINFSVGYVFNVLTLLFSIIIFLLQNGHFYTNLTCEYDNIEIFYTLLSILIIDYLQFIGYLIFMFCCKKQTRTSPTVYMDDITIS